MNAPEALVDDEVILAEESPQQVRVAEGYGAHGAWVAWAGGNRKIVQLIAIDNDAFYATAVPLVRVVGLLQKLRDGVPPSEVMDANRVVRLGKIMDMRTNAKTGRISISYIALTGPLTWSQKGFPSAVQRDLLDEFAERIIVGKRRHRAYTPLRAALYPLFCILVTVGMFLFTWALSAGLFDSEPRTGRGRNEWFEDLAKAIGPTGVLLIGAAIVLGQFVWMVRSVRNPPIMACVQPKATLWGKNKKKPAT